MCLFNLRFLDRGVQKRKFLKKAPEWRLLSVGRIFSIFALCVVLYQCAFLFLSSFVCVCLFVSVFPLFLLVLGEDLGWPNPSLFCFFCGYCFWLLEGFSVYVFFCSSLVLVFFMGGCFVFKVSPNPSLFSILLVFCIGVFSFQKASCFSSFSEVYFVLVRGLCLVLFSAQKRYTNFHFLSGSWFVVGSLF